MKGLSVVVTLLLFVVAVALSNYLKKIGAIPAETRGYTTAEYATNYAAPRESKAMASYVRDTRQFRN